MTFLDKDNGKCDLCMVNDATNFFGDYCTCTECEIERNREYQEE